ncbi:MAG: prenyltransferase [Halieaceae bacterium]|nr:prenyltransferase [Halieaceae bacterium]
MNPRVWAQALNTMPKLTPDEWGQLDVVARWLIATRASVLFMTFMSAALGGLLAAADGAFDWTLWGICCLGLVFAHATNNLLNDYTDSRRGIDRDNYYRNQYGVHVLEDGLLSPRRFWGYVGFTGGVAIALGLWLVWARSGLTLDLMLAGAFFVLFYTWPLKYYGLGEPAVLLVWGPLMVGGTYYVMAGQWSWDVTWLSLLYALGPTTVLFGKHIDKLDLDEAKKVRTLPVILGEARARSWVIAMLVLQYLGCVGLVATGRAHWVLLVVVVNLPVLWRLLHAFRSPKPATAPEGYPPQIWPLWFSALAFDHTRKFTTLFIAALLLGQTLA